MLVTQQMRMTSLSACQVTVLFNFLNKMDFRYLGTEKGNMLYVKNFPLIGSVFVVIGDVAYYQIHKYPYLQPKEEFGFCGSLDSFFSHVSHLADQVFEPELEL